MKIYRLKHKPTGLYFIPSRGSGNLSVKGKLYSSKKPSLDWVSRIRIDIWLRGEKPKGKNKIIIDYFGLDVSKGYIDTYVKTSPDDWEIEEVS